MYKLTFEKRTFKDKQNLRAAGLLPKEAKRLLDIIRQNPFQYPPEYEILDKDYAGNISRRISGQHRLIYHVTDQVFIENDIQYDGIVNVIQMWRHYSD